MSTTETKVRHSPTPWDSKGTALYSNNLSIGIVDIREDAELIVRAVNSHADMLEALEAAREELMHYHVEAQKKAFVIGQIALKGSTLLAVEAAIQKAKGGAA